MKFSYQTAALLPCEAKSITPYMGHLFLFDECRWKQWKGTLTKQPPLRESFALIYTWEVNSVQNLRPVLEPKRNMWLVLHWGCVCCWRDSSIVKSILAQPLLQSGISPSNFFGNAAPREGRLQICPLRAEPLVLGLYVVLTILTVILKINGRRLLQNMIRYNLVHSPHPHLWLNWDFISIVAFQQSPKSANIRSRSAIRSEIKIACANHGKKARASKTSSIPGIFRPLLGSGQLTFQVLLTKFCAPDWAVCHFLTGMNTKIKWSTMFHALVPN